MHKLHGFFGLGRVLCFGHYLFMKFQKGVFLFALDLSRVKAIQRVKVHKERVKHTPKKTNKKQIYYENMILSFSKEKPDFVIIEKIPFP